MNWNDDKGKYKDLPSETVEELYENAPCGYISFVRDGTIVKINKTLLSWLGYDKEEVLYVKKIQSFLNIGGRIFFETHFFPLIRIQGFIKEVNFDLVRKDKFSFPALLNVNEIANPEGNPVAYRATIFDITDRKKYEKELLHAKKIAESAARAKAEFLATISHEIRTPLNAILGIANLIHKTPLNDQQKEYARILKLSSDNLLGLVNDILDFSKIEAGKVKLEEKIFAIKDVVDTLIHTLEVKAKEKKIELKAELDEALPDYLIGDPLKLNQILTNLIGNAIKFTSIGFVKLDMHVLNKDKKNVLLQFKVTDTGVGIPKDKLETIFEEFSQASYDVNLKYGGTGLGLTISQKLLQLYGSKMEVQSEEGRGAEFSFAIKFSISKEKPTEKSVHSNNLDRHIFDSVKILVVEDNPVNIYIISEYLKEWNLTFESVETGVQAIQSVQQNEYDLILMDLQMPEMNGYQTSEAIRRLSLPKQPAIIALSASARGDISDKLRLSGINDYVSKPFNPADLYKAIVYHLKNYGNEEKQNLMMAPPQEEEVEKAEELPVNTSASPFDLSHYVKVAKNRADVLEGLIKKTTDAFEEYKEQFAAAVENKDIGTLEDLIHKSKMAIYYIQAKELEKVMHESKELLDKEEQDASHIQEKLRELTAEFEKVIQGLKSVNASDLFQ